MKKLLISLFLIAFVCLFAHSENDYVQITMDNHRYEMLQVTYSAYSYNIKFDKWTGNIWLYTKDGSTVTMRDPANETDMANKQCIYQLMKGNRDSTERCYVVNTVTGEVWEVIFAKGHSIKFEKR